LERAVRQDLIRRQTKEADDLEGWKGFCFLQIDKLLLLEGEDEKESSEK
jgi:hypothetical protein